MKHTSAFPVIFTMLLAICTPAAAQEGGQIWEPVPPEIAVPAQDQEMNDGESLETGVSGTAGGDMSEATVDTLLSKYVALQRDLYRIVVTFNEQAKVVERNQLSYEVINLKNHEITMIAPNLAEPAAVPDNTDIGVDDELAPEAGSADNPSADGMGLTHFKSPVLCSELDKSLQRYIQKNTPEMERVSKALAGQSVLMTEAEKAQTAEKLRVALAAATEIRRAEEILFLCLYKYKNEYGVPVAYSVEKTLRGWFMLQGALVDAWIGNVD